ISIYPLSLHDALPIYLSAAILTLASTTLRCHSVAQRNASTTLENSTSKPSPVVLTMRPRCSVIVGSIISARIDLSRLRVPSSSRSEEHTSELQSLAYL